MHIWWTYVHMYTKSEASMSNPVARGGVCTDDDNANIYINDNDDTRSMIDQDSLVDKPNEPKNLQETYQLPNHHK